MRAGQILDAAKFLVEGDRKETHGEASNTMSIVAAMWSAYLGHEVTADDASRMMALMKIGRAAGGQKIMDHDLDGAAYLAIAGEIEAAAQATKAEAA